MSRVGACVVLSLARSCGKAISCDAARQAFGAGHISLLLESEPLRFRNLGYVTR